VSFQVVLVGLDLNQLVKYGNVSDYFIGSGEYYDGVRAANGLREAALYLSASAVFVTVILLTALALAATCTRKKRVLIAFFVALVTITVCAITIAISLVDGVEHRCNKAVKWH